MNIIIRICVCGCAFLLFFSIFLQKVVTFLKRKRTFFVQLAYKSPKICKFAKSYILHLTSYIICVVKIKNKAYTLA